MPFLSFQTQCSNNAVSRQAPGQGRAASICRRHSLPSQPPAKLCPYLPAATGPSRGVPRHARGCGCVCFSYQRQARWVQLKVRPHTLGAQRRQRRPEPHSLADRADQEPAETQTALKRPERRRHTPATRQNERARGACSS